MATRLRSALFAAWFVLGTILFCVLAMPAWAKREWCLKASRFWARGVMVSLRTICGLDYELRGELPRGPAVIAAKHQSMWETFAFVALLERPCFVLKQELARIPLASRYWKTNGYIFVDRDGGAGALRLMTREAERAAGEGAQVIIFPEGTRVAPGETGEYHSGVAALVRATGAACHPVAHDAGTYWPRDGLPRGGRITLEAMSPLPPDTPRRTLMAELKSRIEGATRALEARRDASPYPAATEEPA